MEAQTRFAPLFAEAVSSGIDFSTLRQHLKKGVEELLRHPRYKPAAHIWLSGSGDSLFAAQIALPALRRWTGFQGSVLPAIEFARYQAPLLNSKDTLWAISNSGSAARTRETVAIAKSRDIFTVGITGSETGPLAKAADTYIFRPVQDLPTVPEIHRGIFMNMNEFMVTLYTLFYTGLHLGVASGATTRQKCDEILSTCEDAIRSIGTLASEHEETAIALASELKGANTIWTIGAGPSFGTARYCSAKFHEQLPLNGIPEDLEEWAHLQYFLTLKWKERSVVFVLAPPGNSLDRAEELVEGIAAVDGRAIVVTNSVSGRFPKAIKEFRLAVVEDEFLSAFTYHLPTQIFILHASLLMGQAPYALRRADGYQLIRHGVVLEDSAGLS